MCSQGRGGSGQDPLENMIFVGFVATPAQGAFRLDKVLLSVLFWGRFQIIEPVMFNLTTLPEITYVF